MINDNLDNEDLSTIDELIFELPEEDNQLIDDMVDGDSLTAILNSGKKER